MSAKIVVQLAQGDCIQGGVLLHPSFVTLDDIKGKEQICILLSDKKHTDHDLPSVGSRIYCMLIVQF